VQNEAILANSTLLDADIRGAKIDGIDFSTVKIKGTKIDLKQAIHIAESLGAVVQ